MKEYCSRRNFLSAVVAGIGGIACAHVLSAFGEDVQGASAPNPLHAEDSNVLLILFSFHHKNTEKIAKVMAPILGASIKTPQEVTPDDLNAYRLIGFGSGIYAQQHHPSLLELADRLPAVTGRKTFIFSTSGVSRAFALKHDGADTHAILREKLHATGCLVVDEFNCVGWNTNSILKLTGGLNRGRPNAEDLQQAEAFALKLKQNLEQTQHAMAV